MFVFAAIVLMAGCTSKPNTSESTNQEDTTAIVNDQPVVQGLTPELEAAGYTALFNGETLEGWKFFKGKENTRWEVVDGLLHCKPDGTAETHVDIMTEKQYQDFELMFDWKIAAGGNSGVMFRVTEDADEPYYTGPEFQLMDDKGWSGPLKDTQLTGASYDVYPAPNAKVNPAGEWNSGKLVVKGKHVEHFVNGDKVVEYDIESDDWKKRKASSKWKDVKTYGVQPTGYIDLQDHDHEIYFKNILVKVL